MKDWSELEDRYQDLHSTDAKGAEEFKHKMTNRYGILHHCVPSFSNYHLIGILSSSLPLCPPRFQKLVKSMEDEDVMEKRQLSAVHQQRVLAAINEKKRDAMTCYTDALNENPANTHRIQKCLEKLLRALHKDRHHSISHFRHLLNINPSQAQREKDATIQHLNDIERLTNQSLQMLDR
jgi:amyloid beta A4 protein